MGKGVLRMTSNHQRAAGAKERTRKTTATSDGRGDVEPALKMGAILYLCVHTETDQNRAKIHTSGIRYQNAREADVGASVRVDWVALDLGDVGSGARAPSSSSLRAQVEVGTKPSPPSRHGHLLSHHGP